MEKSFVHSSAPTATGIPDVVCGGRSHILVSTADRVGFAAPYGPHSRTGLGEASRQTILWSQTVVKEYLIDLSENKL